MSEKRSVAKLLTVKVPIESLSTCSPSALIACRWAPLATNVTSCPALARRDPKKPPTPPVPTTQIFIIKQTP